MKKLLLIGILALVAAFLLAESGATGVAFTVTNVGSDTLRSVTVKVTGRAYSIGDLSPGKSKSINVDPTGESHIELIFSDSRRLMIDCYFEPRYEGKIAAEVTSQDVVSVKDEVRVPTFF